jgi:hypothetical protein
MEKEVVRQIKDNDIKRCSRRPTGEVAEGLSIYPTRKRAVKEIYYPKNYMADSTQHGPRKYSID